MTKSEIVTTAVLATIVMLIAQIIAYQLQPILGHYSAGVSVAMGAFAAFVVVMIGANARGKDTEA